MQVKTSHSGKEECMPVYLTSWIIHFSSSAHGEVMCSKGIPLKVCMAQEARARGHESFCSLRLKLSPFPCLPEKREHNGTSQPSSPRVLFHRRKLSGSHCELDHNGHSNGDAPSLLPAIC